MKEILKQLREEHFFSQDKVAKELGISRQSYIKYESGEVVPSVEIVKKLSALYEVSYETIIDNKTHLINEYVIKEDKLEVADCVKVNYGTPSMADVFPVYFSKSEMKLISKKASKLNLPLDQFLYKAVLEYNPDVNDTNYFDDFVPLGSSDCKILKDYIDFDYLEETADERYHF